MTTTPEENWIKLNRALSEKSWYKKSQYVHLWIHILITAKFAEVDDRFDGKPIKLKPGQFITGRRKLALDTGVSETQVERILKWFESEHQIEQRKSSTSRCITILNWKKWQTVGQDSGYVQDSGRTAAGQRQDTIKRKKERKKYIRAEKKKNAVPTKEEFVKYFTENGYRADVGERAYNGYFMNGWKDSNDKPVKNWKLKANNVWFKPDNKASTPQPVKDLSGVTFEIGERDNLFKV